MNYCELVSKINEYKRTFNVRVIGKTIFKRKIFAVEKILNKNFHTAFFVSSVHAREFISTDLVCKMIDDGLFDNIENFNLSFILMANPDGVELCKNGVCSAPKKYRKMLFLHNQCLIFQKSFALLLIHQSNQILR